MDPSRDHRDRPAISYAAIGKQAFTVGGEVGCLTVLIVLGAVLGGLWLDKLIGTKPLITILLVLASAPLSLFLTYKIAKRSVGSTNILKMSDGESKPKEGEISGE